MAFAAGTCFGPYEVLAPLGEGGMGEVYRATDTRLGRAVALKVLRADTLDDASARKRFDREARLIAQIQHPHICVLYDVGFERDTPYLVMELLSGETLDARLKRGPLPGADGLRIAAQIAHALDVAHRHGIVHRDLKPANVMLVAGADGVDAKLLDFGVAKALPLARNGEEPGDATVSGVTTIAGLTDARAVVGTLPYMAPEQLAGQTADARTDLWALGCVLYEMVCGTRPFGGETTAIVMAAILEHQPRPLTDRSSLTPPQVDHLVRRCLEKDPERRWQTARDVAYELDWIRSNITPAAPHATPSPTRRTALWIGGALAAVTLVIAAAGQILTNGQDTPRAVPTLVRLSIPAPPDTTFLGGRSAPYFSISPDARRVAFVPTPYRRSASIWVRDLESAAARVIPESAGATYPFWAPDGTRLGFFADGKLKVVDVRGGRPLTICNAPSPRGGSWNQFDEILFTPALDRGLSIVPASGGSPVPVTTLNAERRDVNHKLPSFLPDGRHFLFVNQTSSVESTGIYVGAAGIDAVRLVNVVSKAEFADGFLWYVRDRMLVAHQFDPNTLRLTATPRPTGDEVAGRDAIIGDGLFSVASDGTAVLWSGSQAVTTELVWLDRAGRRLGELAARDRYFSIALSPNERTIAVEAPDPEGPFYSIWTIDVASGLRSRVTSGSLNWGPVWSPDGGQLAYGALRGGPSQTMVQGMNGGPKETSVWRSGEFVGPTGWLPDGRSMVLLDNSNYRVGILPLGPASTVRWVANDSFVNGDGRVSPDGRWLAYTSNESGTWDVYLRSFPAMDSKWRVSPAGGSGPLWRRDSAELYYIDPDQHLVAASVSSTAPPINGQPARLFALPIVPTPPGIDPRLMYAATARGDRFLVNTSTEAGSVLPLTVVLNLSASLRGSR